MFCIKEISKLYHTKDSDVVGIQDMNVTFPDKGLVAIVGKSGSGKTTLMNVLSGLDERTSGSILFGEEVLSDYNEKQWDHFRNQYVGIVFQNFNLVEDMTVEENLALPLKILEADPEGIREEVERVLEYVNLSGYGNRQIHELSAGQKQRIAIARAIIKSPDVILADEVTGNLDSENAKQVFRLLDKISKSCLVVVITHDKAAAYQYGDRILTIADGKLVSDEDNRKAKELSIKEYNILLSDDVNQVTCQVRKSLDELDIKKEILGTLTPDQSEVKYTLSFKLAKEDDTEEQTVLQKRNYKTKSLGFKDMIGMSLANLSKRKVRLAITSILFVFTCTLFFVSNSIYKNDYVRSLSDYMQDKGFNSMVLTRDAVRVDDLGREYQSQLSNGKHFLSDIQTVIKQEDFIPCLEEYDIQYEGTPERVKYCTSNMLIHNKNKYFEKLDIEGRLPEKSNEIVLDMKVAKTLGITSEAINQKVTIYEQEYKVVGIWHTKTDGDERYSILAEAFADSMQNEDKSIHFEGNNLVESAATSEYVHASTGLGSLKWAETQPDKYKLVYGAMPKEKNEILISTDLAERAGWTGDDNFVMEHQLPDLYAKKYNDIYDNKMNMYDYLGKNVKITGIYAKEPEDGNANILIAEDIYKKIRTDYYSSLFYNKYMINIESYDCYTILKKLTDLGFRVDMDTSMYIYLFMDMTAKLQKGLRFAVIVSMFMTICMMLSYIIYNIKDHAKKIGILRAIGVARNDIAKMFLSETCLISLFSVVLAMLCSVLLVGKINDTINQFTKIDTLHVLTMNYWNIGLLSVGIIVISVVMTMFPVFKMVREKAIYLINGSMEEG